MYHFKEVTLKNDSNKKKVLTIVFDDPSMEIIGEYLMADASMLSGEILCDFEQVLRGEKEKIRTSGNRCGLDIGQEKTLVYDLFEDMGEESYSEVRIQTKKLRELTVVWLDELQAFQKNTGSE